MKFNVNMDTQDGPSSFYEYNAPQFVDFEQLGASEFDENVDDYFGRSVFETFVIVTLRIPEYS